MKPFWKAQMQLVFFWFLMLLILTLLIILYQMPAEALILMVILSVLELAGFLAYRRHEFDKTCRLLEVQNFSPDLYPADVWQYISMMEKMQQENRREKEKAFAEQQSLKDYFSLWAHQSKLPLSVLRLLCEHGIQDKRSLRMQINRLSQYIDMAMAYIRLESSSDYQLILQDLDPVIRTALRGFSTEFIYKKIHLDYQEVCQKRITDSKWLTFVIEQILSNAIRYTPAEGTIKIYWQNEALCIEDNGCGIDPADLPRIFEQGFSGWNGHQEKTSSGIGLYLCKKILDQLHHSISIESDSAGTKVMISLKQDDLRIQE